MKALVAHYHPLFIAISLFLSRLNIWKGPSAVSLSSSFIQIFLIDLQSDFHPCHPNKTALPKLTWAHRSANLMNTVQHGHN